MTEALRGPSPRNSFLDLFFPIRLMNIIWHTGECPVAARFRLTNRCSRRIPQRTIAPEAVVRSPISGVIYVVGATRNFYCDDGTDANKVPTRPMLALTLRPHVALVGSLAPSMSLPVLPPATPAGRSPTTSHMIWDSTRPSMALSTA